MKEKEVKTWRDDEEHQSLRASKHWWIRCFDVSVLVSKMVVMLFAFFSLLLVLFLLHSSLLGPSLQQTNPSLRRLEGGLSKVKRWPAALNRCSSRAFPPDRFVHLADDQKAPPSPLPTPLLSFLLLFFLSPSTCVQASSLVPLINSSWASLSWLVGSSYKHTHKHRKYKCRHV